MTTLDLSIKDHYLKVFLIAFICVSGMSFEGCKADEQKNAAVQEAESDFVKVEKVFPTSIQKGGSFRSLEQIRVQAITVINDRIAAEPEAQSIMTAGYWHPDAVVNGREIKGSDYYDGYWIKFEEDFTYTYGVYEDLLGKGKYHFSINDNLLHMLDADVEEEPKVWNANTNGAAITLAGRHHYNVNNGIQMKLTSLFEQPKKS